MGPGDLAQVLEGLDPIDHPDVLIGLSRADDAGVYRLREDLALVQTVDFFTPIVDDPYTFGRIAAVNALSDVYAMGGRPLTALNIVCFPRDSLDLEVLRETLRGGGDVCAEAGVAVVGGHSVNDPEFKFGLSVTGEVHPERILRNTGARAGDRLVLTKPLGTGAVTTGIKRQTVGAAEIEAAVTAMAQLNRAAAEVLGQYPVHAMTDVTGFGLLGHLAEMIEDQPCGCRVELSQVPLLPGALACAEAGVLPGGLKRNRAFRESLVDVVGDGDPHRISLLYDPQTSGGLLAALDPEACDRAIAALHEAGVAEATTIGEFVASPRGRIQLR